MWNDDRDDCETIVDGCDLLWAVVIFCCRLLSFVGDFGRLWGDCGRLFAIGFFIMVFGGGGNAQNFTADPIGLSRPAAVHQTGLDSPHALRTGRSV